MQTSNNYKIKDIFSGDRWWQAYIDEFACGRLLSKIIID
jgi:hypothetical protein